MINSFYFFGAILFFWYFNLRYSTHQQEWTYEPFHMLHAQLALIVVTIAVLEVSKIIRFNSEYGFSLLTACIGFCGITNVYWVTKNIHEYVFDPTKHNNAQLCFIGLGVSIVIFMFLLISLKYQFQPNFKFSF